MEWYVTHWNHVLNSIWLVKNISLNIITIVNLFIGIQLFHQKWMISFIKLSISLVYFLIVSHNLLKAIVWFLVCRKILREMRKCALCAVFIQLIAKAIQLSMPYSIERWIIVHIMTWQIYLAANRTHLLQLKEIGDDNSICFTFWLLLLLLW